MVVSDSLNYYCLPVPNNVSSFFVAACSCNPLGSVRTDCEQTSGRCVCKPGIVGVKCDICPDGKTVNDKGCNGCEYKDTKLDDKLQSDTFLGVRLY